MMDREHSEFENTCSFRMKAIHKYPEGINYPKPSFSKLGDNKLKLLNPDDALGFMKIVQIPSKPDTVFQQNILQNRSLNNIYSS